MALFRCFKHGALPGPLATWPKWKVPGRRLNKGEMVLTLCMPFACKRTRTATKADGTELDGEFTIMHFTQKPHWFVFAQTEGPELESAVIPPTRTAGMQRTHGAHKPQLISL